MTLPALYKSGSRLIMDPKELGAKDAKQAITTNIKIKCLHVLGDFMLYLRPNSVPGTNAVLQ
jgi:hypothetical protein